MGSMYNFTSEEYEAIIDVNLSCLKNPAGTLGKFYFLSALPSQQRLLKML